MIVPAWAWWFTYLAAPLAAVVLVALRRWGWPPRAAGAARGVRVRRGAAVALGVSALCNAFDFLRMLGDVNGFGSLVYLAILVSQVGLAATVVRATPAPPEVAFAAVALATTVTMLLVRAQVIWIFG